MPTRTKTSTTRLPQALREQIAEAPDTHHLKHSKRQQPSRKEARKQQRTDKKQRKVQFFTATSTGKRPADGDLQESPQRKKPRIESSNNITAPGPRKILEKASAPVKKTPKESKEPKLSLRSQKEKDDDAYIAYLESKLGGKRKAEDDDGLDDLLDFTNSLGNFENDLPPEEIYSDEEGLSEEDESDEDSEEDSAEWGGIDRAASEDDDSSELTAVVEEEDQKKDDIPDIPEPNATRYIPPHLRNPRTPEKTPPEAALKLTRQLKGLLNRMSEQNLAAILDSIEEIYRDNRRNDVTSTLTTLIIDGISSHSSLLESYVVLHAAFVASLHKLVGVEFAAYFVQNVVSSYEAHYSQLQEGDTDDSDKGKECSNLIVLLSELYNFQVISCILIFDIIRSLLATEVSEFNTELLLKITRNSGQQLRQDDPSALKDIMDIVHEKLKSKDNLSSRTKFIVETLTNLKNNRLKHNASQNQGGDAVDRMKKFLTTLSKKRQVLAHEPLRVSLEDLHSAETKGKWWLVGAAWGGDPIADQQKTKMAKDTASQPSESGLVKLAKKLGMNTDIRRSIFIVLMSSDDYVDACERLSQLNLTEVQQREIIRVLLRCCGNEKTYNPYYTLVCQQLCRQSHSYKITLQFCLWDFFRDLGETEVGGTEVVKSLKENGGADRFESKVISPNRIRNLATAYGWLISKDCVTLAILKPIDFTLLQEDSIKFLKQIIAHILADSQTMTPIISANAPTTRDRKAIEEVFMKATRMEELAMGLIYFLTNSFREVEDKFQRWAIEVAKETLRREIL